MGPADAIVPAASAPGRSRRVWCYGLLAAVWIGLDAWLLPALVSDAATLAVARPASNLLFVVVSLLLLLKWLPGTAARQRPVDEPAHALAPSARDERAPDELRRLLERIEDGVVALDSQWVYTYLNSQAARMLGRDSPQDLIGRHIWTEFPDGVGQPFHLAY